MKIFFAYTAAFLGVCGHASSEFFVRLAGISGVEVSVWRFGIGGIALLVLSISSQNSRDLFSPFKQDAAPICCLSIFGMAFGQFLFHWALDFASVVQVATMITIMPIGVVFVARVIEGTKITAPKIVSGVGAFLGCIFLLTDGYLDQLTGNSRSLIGISLSIFCAIIGAIYLVLVKPYIQKYGSIRMTTYTFVLGFFALYPAVGFLWGNWIDPTTLLNRPPTQIASLVTLGVWNTCIAFVLWLWGLANVPDVGRGNYLFFLKPIIALCLAYFILNDSVSLNQLLAIFAVTAFVLGEIFYESLAPRVKMLFHRIIS